MIISHETRFLHHHRYAIYPHQTWGEENLLFKGRQAVCISPCVWWLSLLNYVIVTYLTSKSGAADFSLSQRCSSSSRVHGHVGPTTREFVWTEALAVVCADDKLFDDKKFRSVFWFCFVALLGDNENQRALRRAHELEEEKRKAKQNKHCWQVFFNANVGNAFRLN